MWSAAQRLGGAGHRRGHLGVVLHVQGQHGLAMGERSRPACGRRPRCARSGRSARGAPRPRRAAGRSPRRCCACWPRPRPGRSFRRAARSPRSSQETLVGSVTVVPRRPDRAARYHPGSLRPRRRTATLPACSAPSSSSSPSPPCWRRRARRWGTRCWRRRRRRPTPAWPPRPSEVTLTFSEPVEIVQSEDIDVVDAEGNDVTGGPATNDAQARVVEIPLRPGLADGTYTVRYKVVSSDSHVIARRARVRRRRRASSASRSSGGRTTAPPRPGRGG